MSKNKINILKIEEFQFFDKIFKYAIVNNNGRIEVIDISDEVEDREFSIIELLQTLYKVIEDIKWEVEWEIFRAITGIVDLRNLDNIRHEVNELEKRVSEDIIQYLVNKYKLRLGTMFTNS